MMHTSQFHKIDPYDCFCGLWSHDISIIFHLYCVISLHVCTIMYVCTCKLLSCVNLAIKLFLILNDRGFTHEPHKQHVVCLIPSECHLISPITSLISINYSTHESSVCEEMFRSSEFVPHRTGSWSRSSWLRADRRECKRLLKKHTTAQHSETQRNPGDHQESGC